MDLCLFFSHLHFLCFFLTYIATKPNNKNLVFVSHFPHYSSNDSVSGINIILPINQSVREVRMTCPMCGHTVVNLSLFGDGPLSCFHSGF